MDALSKAFEAILADPIPFIADRSVTRLFWFMYGFQQGANLTRADDPLYDGFQPWLQKRLHLNKPAHAWVHMMLFVAFDSESEAFNLTKELWHEYKSHVEKSL